MVIYAIKGRVSEKKSLKLHNMYRLPCLSKHVGHLDGSNTFIIKLKRLYFSFSFNPQSRDFMSKISNLSFECLAKPYIQC